MGLGQFFKDHGLGMLEIAASTLPFSHPIIATAKAVAGMSRDSTEPQMITALQANPDMLVKLRQYELDNGTEIRKAILNAQARADAEETARLTQVNLTMRAELEHEGWYKSSWRPTFGYGFTAAWLGLIGVVGYSIIETPEMASEVINAVAALQPWFIAGAAVLGVNIHQRSKDKQVAAGQEPKGLLGK